MDRADIVHENFIRRVSAGDFPVAEKRVSFLQSGLTETGLKTIFRSQMVSRHLDRISRKMQAAGEGFYTIGSSGHEGNAAIADGLRVSDPAFLHYRDAAFQIHRSTQLPGQTPIRDFLLSFATSKDDPISGGRHKVLGSKALNIPPQTSTIASHLPKAVGAAYSIGLCRKVSPEHQAYPDDAVVLCSFGDASLNHSTAQGALNTAGWTSIQGIALPLIFLCEDNGIGISTKTPVGWVEASMSNRAGLEYVSCNGLDVLETRNTISDVAKRVRRTRKPVFMHMKTVRLYGHAGADAQQAYLTKEEIETDESNDPLLHTARILIENNLASTSEILSQYEEIGEQVECVSREVITRPRLKTAEEVMASIVPPKRSTRPGNGPSETDRKSIFGDVDARALGAPQHMAKLINFALTDLMLEHNEIVLAGEDVGQKGGVYGVTQRLVERFGPRRVINALLDEQSILGLAIGMGQNGFLPIPEIQFLAYLHNAEDQLRGEAATLSFFSNGQFTNPMVVRIAGLGYQRGFGGHFHNDNSLTVLRDIPGLIVCVPSNGRDAVLMLRECVRLAREEQRVVVFVEPIALYMTRDLHEAKDGAWMFDYPKPGADPVGIGEVGILREGRDVAILTYGNGSYLSCQAERILREQHGISAKVVDIRWIAPLPKEALLEAIDGFENILIVDECRISGSPSEALMAMLHENHTGGGNYSRYAAEDSFISTGPAFGATLPSREGIVQAVLELWKKGNRK